MGIAFGPGVEGTCPCRRCQRSRYYTPAQRVINKMAKTGMTMPDKLKRLVTRIEPTPEQAELLRQAHEQVPVWDVKPKSDDDK